jgi:DNA-binding transcriptional regulator WhiA
MLIASEVKAELARIVPARACCRRAELTGLLYGDRSGPGLRTLDHATARIGMQLAASLGLQLTTPTARPPARGRGRHHLEVGVPEDAVARAWTWEESPSCDRRAFLRGVVLGSGSVSLTASGPHVEFVFRDRRRTQELLRRLAEVDVNGSMVERRGRWVAYLKGQEAVARLLQLTGASRGLLELETARVGRDVRNRLNRLLNAEEANLARTVRAADRQLQAIAILERHGILPQLPEGLRAAAAQRRLHPESDLDTLAGALGVSRSTTNHRLRRLVELAREADGDGGLGPPRSGSARTRSLSAPSRRRGLP